MQATAIQTLPAASVGAARRPASRSVSAMRMIQQQQQKQRLVAVRALGDSTQKTQKGIRREDEPEEYWSSQAEKEGKSPFQDPLAQIGILAILFPFIFLLFAIAFGWVDLSAGRL